MRGQGQPRVQHAFPPTNNKNLLAFTNLYVVYQKPPLEATQLNGMNNGWFAIQLPREHDPFEEFEIRKPRWLWAVGIGDIVLAFINGNNLQEKEHMLSSMVYYTMISYFIVQFFTGCTLLYGLSGHKESTISAWLKWWVFESLVLLLENGFFFLNNVTLFATKEMDEKESVYLVAQIFATLADTIVRMVAVLTVSNFLCDMRIAVTQMEIMREQFERHGIQNPIPIPE